MRETNGRRDIEKSGKVEARNKRDELRVRDGEGEWDVECKRNGERDI